MNQQNAGKAAKTLAADFDRRMARRAADYGIAPGGAVRARMS
ncbi:MAG TPA: hypothetical protein VFY40_21560 [Blastocatellia bacterium]|nr:hypothetical protein [Blastocatellia bacterium]